MDEDNGYAIVARKVALSHELFCKDKPGDRINWKSTSLPAGGNWLTPAIVLKEIAQGLLSGQAPSDHWLANTKSREIPLRPAEEQIEQAIISITEVLDHFSKIPCFAAILRGEDIDVWREFPSTKTPGGRSHLLMRPLGQLALAKAIGTLHFSDDGPKIPLGDLFEKVNRFDKKRGFQNVQEQSSCWWGITFEPIKKKMLMADKDAFALMVYLLSGRKHIDYDELLKNYRKARTLPKAGEEGEDYINFDGNKVSNKEDIQLPPLI